MNRPAHGIARALISVSDKTGIENLARRLSLLGIEILSTGGTAKTLRAAGIPVKDVSAETGFPEILGGRVKTLHPKIHGGILGKRDDAGHRKEMEEHGIAPIDLVCINLYPFVQTVSKPGTTLSEACEQIDIGGPAMVRASAKNFRDVVILTDPSDYDRVLALLESGFPVGLEVRQELSAKAYRMTSAYDAAIASYLGQTGEGDLFPGTLSLSYTLAQTLRYGENPHQKGAFYRSSDPADVGVGSAVKRHGKELSYNNVLDAHSALALVREFPGPATVIVKHNNPCGASTGTTLLDTYRQARDTDPVSSFGGVVATNRVVDLQTAEEMAKIFLEVVIAPGFSPEALSVLTKKKDIRLLEAPEAFRERGGNEKEILELRSVSGGLLLQTPDRIVMPARDQVTLATKRVPTDAEWQDAVFAFTVGKHVRSNAIILVKDQVTVGIGAGQMSRVDSVRLSGMKANRTTQGTVLASDAFFPFRDGIDEAAKLGVAGIVQPGGSIRDKEVFEAADEYGMFMILTGVRHFKH
ncbi:MAG: bifunctional phosphoribosylaminoimidazolecarboxamide formyltransferase/IMP cyclohydrolase [Nitrospirae bacterium]|nr:bifunctional phosphoribosylaminoimidazolecarboxamide formyltransferase/IMP cyclohydrolase [Nitrospirota bacterium]MCL5284922.1 bifunctional phosphoribosylaminoimidazolecarboxamide formyltransferase/IMP cyclohydrolase [Nitrospirota bacterium]